MAGNTPLRDKDRRWLSSLLRRPRQAPKTNSPAHPIHHNLCHWPEKTIQHSKPPNRRLRQSSRRLRRNARHSRQGPLRKHPLLLHEHLLSLQGHIPLPRPTRLLRRIWRHGSQRRAICRTIRLILRKRKGLSRTAILDGRIRSQHKHKCSPELRLGGASCRGRHGDHESL